MVIYTFLNSKNKQTKNMIKRRQIFNLLSDLYPKYACREHQRILPLLRDNCGFTPDGIPQLEDVNTFLKGKFSFILKRNIY